MYTKENKTKTKKTKNAFLWKSITMNESANWQEIASTDITAT